jgi:hypothetical protein
MAPAKGRVNCTNPHERGFPRNPYTVNNVDDLCEIDTLGMGSLISHNDGHSYLLDAIDAFSNYVYSVPISSSD